MIYTRFKKKISKEHHNRFSRSTNIMEISVTNIEENTHVILNVTVGKYKKAHSCR